MSAKKCQRDTMILLFVLVITPAFAECRHELERLSKNYEVHNVVLNLLLGALTIMYQKNY